MASITDRKEAAKAEARQEIELEKKGLKPPTWEGYVIVYPLMVAFSYFIFKDSLIESLLRSLFFVLGFIVFDEIVYRRKLRKEK